MAAPQMTFLLSLLGSIVFVSGLAWLATLLGAAQVYVVAGALVLFLLSVVGSIANTRRTAEPA
ncbi:MAG: hypothetical protein ABI789_01035 [Usitatibacter sp.]